MSQTTQKPVVFVPGLPSSHLHDRADGTRFYFKLWSTDDPRLEGPSNLRNPNHDVRAGEPIQSALSFLFFDLAKQAGRLYDILERIDCRPIPVGWDWRRPVYDDVFPDPAGPYSVQHRLAADIEKHAGAGRVPVIVHSTGGLVLRSLLEKRPELSDKIERVIALGVPWAGAPKSLHIMNAGDDFALTSPEEAQQIIVRSWAGWDLAPPDPTHVRDHHGEELFLTYRKSSDGTTKQQASALTDKDWIHSLPAHLRADAEMRRSAAHAHLGARRPTFDLQGHRLEIVNIAGFGYTTPYAAELLGTGADAKLRVDVGQRDGTRAEDDGTLDDGDGTAPFRSALWVHGDDHVSVASFQIPMGLVAGRGGLKPHSRIWSTPGGSDLLRHHLGDVPLDDAFCHAALDHVDVEKRPVPDPIRMRAVATDLQGQPLQDVVLQTRRNAWEDRPIEASFDGRFLVDVPRSHARLVQGGRVRRLEARIGWLEDGERRWRRQNFAFAVGS